MNNFKYVSMYLVFMGILLELANISYKIIPRVHFFHRNIAPLSLVVFAVSIPFMIKGLYDDSDLKWTLWKRELPDKGKTL